MKNFVLIACILFLASCARVEEAKDIIRDKLVKFNDAELELGLDIVCNKATVGAIRRKYNGDYEQWSKACPQFNHKVDND